MANRIEVRGDTAANWTTANPVLAAREIAVETDTKRIKIGDGATAWTGLGYVTHPPSALDADMAAAVTPGGSATAAAIAADPALRAAYATYLTLAANPDTIIAGTITRDSNGAATSAPVVWPDGSPGTYTADTVSTAFPGAVDAYHITYGSPVTKTYTQTAVTRDATTGAVTVRPALTVA